MPFGFLKRQADTPPARETSPAEAGSGRPVDFDGLTEEWRLVGQMHIRGRLSDAMNKREAVTISDIRWMPIDGSAPFTDAPGLKSVDPYDLVIVYAGEGSLPLLTDSERTAHRVHKVTYDVALSAPPFRIVGTVHLHPGSDPSRLLDRATDMFLPVVDAVASVGDRPVWDEPAEAILVNRFYLRGVDQVDRRTGERAQKLPGLPLGGVSWQERTR